MARHRPHVPRLSPHWLRHERRPLLPGHLAGRTTTRSSIRPATARAPRRRARGTPGRIRFPTPSRAVFRCWGSSLATMRLARTIPAGSVYLDAITATGGTQNCAVATGTGAHTFEWRPAPSMRTSTRRTARTLTPSSRNQPTRRTGEPARGRSRSRRSRPRRQERTTSRRVFIDGPNIYCGQTATVHVYAAGGQRWPDVPGLHPVQQLRQEQLHRSGYGDTGRLEHLRVYRAQRPPSGRAASSNSASSSSGPEPRPSRVTSTSTTSPGSSAAQSDRRDRRRSVARPLGRGWRLGGPAAPGF